MKLQELGMHEMARSGFTHKAIISAEQGDFTAAALSQVFNLAALVAGWIVGKASLRLVTPLAGGAIATATASVGDVNSAGGFITTSDIFTGSTVPIKNGDGAYLAQAGGKAYIGAETLQVAVVVTGGNVNTATEGEIHVYFSLFKLADL